MAIRHGLWLSQELQDTFLLSVAAERSLYAKEGELNAETAEMLSELVDKFSDPTAVDRLAQVSVHGCMGHGQSNSLPDAPQVWGP